MSQLNLERRVVCAANRWSYKEGLTGLTHHHIILGARHWDKLMHYTAHQI